MNSPQPLMVESDAAGRPVTVVLRGRRVAVRRVEDMWSIEDGWWQEAPVSRCYWRLTLADGRTVTVFRDRQKGTWWRQSY